VADDKKTKLSIVIQTVDQATAKIKAINDRLDKVTKPVNDFKKALGDLREKSGLDDVIGGFKGVGSAIGDLLGKVAMIGGVVGLAGAAVFHLVSEFDDLGDKAEILGVSADFLSAMRYAAEKAGAPVEALDVGMQAFAVSLGKAKAGTGRMLAFVSRVSPALATQLKAAKSNEEAFYLLAAAMDKLKDPAKRSALAAASGLGPELAPLLAQGEKGIKALADRYHVLAPGMQEAADKAGAVDDSLHDLHATEDGLKAAIVTGLAPALKVIVDQLSEWFSSHQTEVREFAASIGEKLPAAFNATVDAVKGAVKWVISMVDKFGGLKNVGLALAAVMTGPLIAAIVSFGIALTTTPFGLFLVGVAGVVAAVALAVKSIQKLAAAGRFLGEKAAYAKLVAQHTDEIRDNNPDLSDEEVDRQARSAAAYDIGQSHAREDLEDRMLQAQIDGTDMPGVVPTADASRSAMYAPDAPSPNDGFPGAAMAQSFAEAMRAAPPTKTMLTVDFANAPKGMRVTTDPKSTADVDLNVGYYSFGVTP
jgi:hypothetical protein